MLKTAKNKEKRRVRGVESASPEWGKTHRCRGSPVHRC